ncbi:unnamed protein product [Owenia fusiformis]|uniref:Uncharacterized protein n=1 Tax=Owenia fusiformis TaxID=6347 RepID=A0A8S4PJE6_OWEFU|nr:unnamed protein product [Owenia fusiformis]
MDLTKAVAIVGISCNFPGGEGIETFWETLVKSKNHLKIIPNERFNIDAFYDSNRDAKGKTYTKHAAFLDSVFDFDNRLFNMNEIEASRADPQHRITLECVFKAFEDGGFPLNEMSGSNTGVYIGSMNDDYKGVTGESFDSDNYMSTGTARAILANRVSYTFNLLGPSLTVDTACSSSLVAIHLGRQAILTGECDMAVCGGTNVLLSPYMFINLSSARMSSEKGQCHAFSEDADGYIRGEGCGIVILKSVEQALRDNDKIWGYIGTGINSDGRMVTPMTAPSMERQQQLMEHVLARMDVDPKYIDYVEAHGTGTEAGDPIEARSVGMAIATKRPNEFGPCPVGSVKTNIGHTESAAGVASLIKILLMMKYNTIAPTIVFNRPNPNIDFVALNIRLPTEVEVWTKQNDKPRLASLNCYGFGGTNSFGVVQQHIQEEESMSHIMEQEIVVLSANNTFSLMESIRDLLACLNTVDMKLEHLAYTSTIRRTHFDKRIAVVGADIAEIKKGLEVRLDSVDAVHIRRERLRIIFVFCGMGTHWVSMGVEMLTNHVESVFSQTLLIVDQQISKQEGWSLINKLKTKSDLSEPSIGQPAIFAIQVALARQWIEWGIKPSHIIGHSVGEVAACCIAGRLSLESATNVIVARGKCIQEAGGGGMLVVSNYEIENIKREAEKIDLEIAAINSPISCTLSGARDNVSAILDQLDSIKQAENVNIFLRELDVSVAYHSKFMDPILGKLKRELHAIDLDAPEAKEPNPQLISSVTGLAVTENDYVKPEYWLQNVRQTVLFREAMGAAMDSSCHNLILEVGPRPALRKNIQDNIGQHPHTILPSFRPNKEWSSLMASLGRMYEHGLDIDWEKVSSSQHTPIPFPRYQFKRNHVKYYPDVAESIYKTGEKGIFGNVQTHPFITGGLDGQHFVCDVKIDKMPFVFDHKSSNRILVPGATYAELGISCSMLFDKRLGLSECVSSSVRFLSPCTLESESATTKLDIHISSEKPDFVSFTISSEKNKHAIGSTTFSDCYIGETNIDVKQIEARCPDEYDGNVMYEQLEKYKFTYGLSLRGIKSYKTNGNEWLLQYSMPESVVDSKDRMLIHPAVLDNILQALALVPEDGETAFPFEIRKLTIRKSLPSEALIYIQSELVQEDRIVCHAALTTEVGEVVIECKDITLKLLTGKQISHQVDVSYSVYWEKLQNPDNNSEHVSQKCLILKDPTGIMEKLRPFINSDSTFISPPTADLYEDFISNSQSLENILNCHSASLNRYDLVIFAWGIQDVNEINVASMMDEVETPILFACSALRQLVQWLYRMSPETPLYIVTNGSQVFPDRKGPISLCGSSIWAMTRTLAREKVFNNLFQIDLSTGSDFEVESLSSHINKAPDHPELLYKADDVYVNQIKPYANRSVEHRLPISNINNTKRVLISAASGKITDPTFMIQYQNCPTGLSNSECLVYIDSFRICNSGLFGLVDLNAIVTKPWGVSSNKYGYPVNAIDFIGHAKIQKTNKFEKVLVCYPHVVETTLVAPRSCVFSLKKIPFETGSLYISMYVICWNIITKHLKLKHGSAIYMSGFEQHRDLGHLLCGLLEASDIQVTTNVTRTSHAIILVDGHLDMEKIQYMQKAETVKQIVLIETMNSTKNIDILCQAFRHKSEISVLQTNLVLSPYNLQKTLKKVIEWTKSVKLFQNPLPIHRLEAQVDFDALNKPDLDSNAIYICNLRRYPACSSSGQRNNHLGKKWQPDSRNSITGQFDGCMTSTCDMTKKELLNHIQQTTAMEQLEHEHQGLGEFAGHCFPVYVGKDQLFRPDAAYIHIGSTNGLTSELMKHMAMKGAGYQIILSRSGGNQTQDMLNIEREFGVKIITISADVTKIETLHHAVEHFYKIHPDVPIKGIFNGAVIVEDGPLTIMDEIRFQRATKPKIKGSWNLHLLSLDMNLDFFVMHSSMASIFGNPGQSNYCAGNGFQDALSLFRRHHGYPSLTINWGAMDLGTLKSNEKVQRMLEKDGINTLDANCIAECFDFALTANPEQITFVNANWKKIFKSRLIKVRNIWTRFEDLMKIHSPETYDAILKGAHNQTENELMAGDVTEATGVRVELKRLLAKLVMTDEDEMDDSTSILELGIDSVVVVALQSEISITFGVDIPIVDLLNETTTISQLVEKLGGDSDGVKNIHEVNIYDTIGPHNRTRDLYNDVKSNGALEGSSFNSTGESSVIPSVNGNSNSPGDVATTSHSTQDKEVTIREPMHIPFRNRDGRPALVYHNDHITDHQNLKGLNLDLPTLEKGDVFDKKTRHGLKKKKQVVLKVIRDASMDSIVYAISWNSRKHGLVLISELTSVKYRTDEEFYLLDIETAKRTFTFSTTIKDTATKWYNGLTELVNVDTTRL